MLKSLRTWLRHLLRPRAIERSLDDELRACVDILAAEKVKSGEPAEDARRLALIEIGGVEGIKERVRDGRSGTRLEAWAWDTRYALRAIRRNWVFALTNALLIALCVALTASNFAVLDAVAIRRLPVPQPERLVLINEIRPDLPVGTSALTAPLLDEIRRRTDDATHVFGFSGLTLGIGSGEAVRKGRVFGVTGDYFAALGATPQLGRLFARDEAEPVAVISDALWRTVFDADANVVGRIYQLGTMSVPIVGVTKPDFVGTQPDSSWDAIVPLQWFQRARNAPDSQWYTARQEAGARLRDGVTVQQFESHLNAAWPAIVAAAAPPTVKIDEWRRQRGTRVTVGSLATGLSYLKMVDPAMTRAVTVTFSLAVVVCFAAYLTVALLAVARSVRQRHQTAVMIALGSSRVRALRPYAIETTLTATIGCLLGLALAVWWVKVAAVFAPGDWRISIDARALAIGVAVATAAALTGGGFGALLLWRASMRSAFRQDARTAHPHVTLRRGLLIAQCAVAVVLLHYALVYVTDVSRLLRINAGFKVADLQVFHLSGVMPYRSLEQDYFQQLEAAIRHIPGVDVVGLAGTSIPFSYLPDASQPVTAEGRQSRATTRCVFPGYFDVLQLPRLAGRDLAWNGREAVITANLSARLFGADQPIGRSITANKLNWQIVGVVGDLTFGSPRGGMTPLVFVPCGELNRPLTSNFSQHVVLRSSRSLPDLEPDIRRAAGQLKTHYLFDAYYTDEALTSALRSERMLAVVSGTAGTVIVILTGVGLYGFCAYVLTLRSRELAIRSALGAAPRHLRFSIFSETLRIVAAGTLVGALVTLVARQVAAKAGMDLAALAPWGLAASIAVLAIIAICATVAPTARATRQDLAKVLRCD